MAKKEFKSNTIIAFLGKAKAKFIDSTIKRLISTEEDGLISFWVDGDRAKAYFVDSFDLASETPIFAKIDNNGPGKDDWVGCIVTVNTALPIDPNPYKNKFDSTVVQNLQDQGFSVVIHYYGVEFKKQFEVQKVSEFRKGKTNSSTTDLIYPGGHWGYSNLFSDSKQNGTTDLTTYNEETLDIDIDSTYREIRLSIGDSSSNDNTLGSDPHFFKITRSPFALALQKRIFGSRSDDSPLGDAIKKDFSNEDQAYILDTIFDRTYLRTEEQDYYSTTLYNSPILNNNPNFIKSDDTLLFNIFNYPHLNKEGEPVFKNIIVIGGITKHTFF